MAKHTRFAVLIPLLLTSFLAAAADYGRELAQENGKMIYTVTERAPHLYMISRDLYGNEKNWLAIARWNKIAKPYDVAIGQKLFIDKAPTLSEAEANRVLMKAWGQLNRWEVVEGIVLHQHGQEPKRQVAQEAGGGGAVVPTAPPVAPAPEAAEPEATKAEAPKADPPAEAAKTEAPPATEATHADKAEHAAHAAHAEHKKWHFGVSLLGLVTELDSNWESENSHTKLYTDIDYGFEAKLAFHPSERFTIYGLGALEHLEVRPGAGGVAIEGGKRDLVHLAAGGEYAFTHRFGLNLAYHHKEEPLVEPTVTGAKIETLFLSQANIGPRFHLVDTDGFGAILGADYIHSFAKKDGVFDLKDGQGFEAFLEFENHMSFGAIIYGVKYRYLRQDSSESKDTQRIYSANLGLGW